MAGPSVLILWVDLLSFFLSFTKKNTPPPPGAAETTGWAVCVVSQQS